MSTSKQSPKEANMFSMEDFENALAAEGSDFVTGQIVKGTIQSFDTNGVYIEIGAKSLAFVPIQEASASNSADLSVILPIGSEHEFIIIKEQNADGQLTLSRKRLELQKAWDELIAFSETGQTLTVRVTGSNKGGVTARVKGLQGFIPRSHLVSRDDLDALKGQSLTVAILELDPGQNRLVLSERNAARAASLSQFAVGQLVEGRIANIKPFGVIVEFDGTTGLLHINQVSNSFVRSLDTLFQVGQTIKAVITAIDESRGRISLSTRVLESAPGEMIDGRMEKVMAEAEVRAERLNQKGDV
jgi:small subunit ribosomal protein S1